MKNQIDDQNRKQGYWEHTMCNVMLSGVFLNDRKVGLWEYYFPSHCKLQKIYFIQ